MKKIVVIGAEWCANCKVLKNSLTSAGVEFTYLDFDDDGNEEFITSNSVRSLPTSFILEGEEIVKTILGAKPVSEFQ